MQEEAEAVLSSYTHQLNVVYSICVHLTIRKHDNAIFVYCRNVCSPESDKCNDVMQEEAEAMLSSYNQQLNSLYTENMAAKMGLQTYNKDLSVQLLSNMYTENAGEQSTAHNIRLFS